MQDNEKIYRIELTNEEYEFLENLKNEFCNKLSKMTKEELTEYLKEFYPEQNLNVNGKPHTWPKKSAALAGGEY